MPIPVGDTCTLAMYELNSGRPFEVGSDGEIKDLARERSFIAAGG